MSDHLVKETDNSRLLCTIIQYLNHVQPSVVYEKFGINSKEEVGSSTKSIFH